MNFEEPFLLQMRFNYFVHAVIYFKWLICTEQTWMFSLWYVDGRKLCTGSRDNWMCLWDIESAKCEQRHNISRNLVRINCFLFVIFIQWIVPCMLNTSWCVAGHRTNGMNESLDLDLQSSCPAGFTFLHLAFSSLQVTHVCWVPGSSSVVQTSEDKTIRYRRICYFSCFTAAWQ